MFSKFLEDDLSVFAAFDLDVQSLELSTIASWDLLSVHDAVAASFPSLRSRHTAVFATVPPTLPSASESRATVAAGVPLPPPAVHISCKSERDCHC